MAALPVIPLSSTDLIQNGGQYFVEGGPAEGVYAFASTDSYPAEGGSAQPVYVVSDAEAAVRGVTGGTKRLMKQVARGSRPTIGGAAKPVYVLGGAFDPTTVAFAPNQIAGLSLWLDAADASTLFQDSALTTPAVADAAPVGGWKDKSGGGFNALQATAGFRPLLKKAVQNGRDVLRFDGVDDFLATLTLGLSQPNTIYVVAKQTSKVANNARMVVGGVNAQIVTLRVTTGFYRIQASAGLEDAIDHSAAFVVMGAVMNGVSSVGYVNNTSVLSGDVGAGAFSTATLGADSGGAANNLIGDMAEVSIYSGAHTPAQIALWSRYAGTKWGIAVA